MTAEHIAKVVHAANRDYCQTLGDMSQVIWECTMKEIRASAIDGVQKLLANPELSAEQMHESWANFKLRHGWKFGEKKDERKKTHPCLVPYAQLPEAQRVKDHLFRGIVLALRPFVTTEKK